MAICTFDSSLFDADLFAGKLYAKVTESLAFAELSLSIFRTAVTESISATETPISKLVIPAVSDDFYIRDCLNKGFDVGVFDTLKFDELICDPTYSVTLGASVTETCEFTDAAVPKLYTDISDSVEFDESELTNIYTDVSENLLVKDCAPDGFDIGKFDDMLFDGSCTPLYTTKLLRSVVETLTLSDLFGTIIPIIVSESTEFSDTELTNLYTTVDDELDTSETPTTKITPPSISETLSLWDCTPSGFDIGLFDSLKFDSSCVPLYVTKLIQAFPDSLSFTDLWSVVAPIIVSESIVFTETDHTNTFTEVNEDLELPESPVTKLVIPAISETLELDLAAGATLFDDAKFDIDKFDGISDDANYVTKLLFAISEDAEFSEYFLGALKIFETDSLSFTESATTKIASFISEHFHISESPVTQIACSVNENLFSSDGSIQKLVASVAESFNLSETESTALSAHITETLSLAEPYKSKLFAEYSEHLDITDSVIYGTFEWLLLTGTITNQLILSGKLRR